MGVVTVDRRVFNVYVSSLLAGLMFPVSRTAQAKGLPSVVDLIVPFSPGGGTDQLARDFAQASASGFAGSSMVVENKPGANGAIAARFVSRQKPDGSCLLLGSSSTQALGPLIVKTDVDPVKDLTAVTLLAETANALAVSADSPYKTLHEFLAAAMTKSMTFGTFGAGSSGHLYGMLLAASTGAKMLHVPYKGSGQAVTDLLGNHVASVFLTTSALGALAKANKIRVLAVTGSHRTGILPDVPTFEEQGIKSLDFNGWFALFAPKDTPANVVEDLAERSRSAIKSPGFAQRMKDQGYDWIGSTPKELAQALQSSIAVYKGVLAKHPIGL